jgi:hypothetical protein
VTFGTSNEADSAAQAVIVLAGINRSMWDIHRILSSKSAIDKVTHSCDARRYPWDGGRTDSPEWHAFEVFVEVETKAGDPFC